MRLKYLIVAAALVIFAMQIDWSTLDRVRERVEGEPRASAKERTLSGRVSVVDGDTLVMRDGRRIRLFGIDAPENDQTCLDGKGVGYRCGNRSADALAGLIGRSGQVECSVRDIDQYQRFVALCRTAEGVELNKEMVRAGWAVDYQRFSRRKFASEQREAQIDRRGIWAGSFEMPAEWRRGKGR